MPASICEKEKSHPLLVGMQTCTATIEISGWLPQEAGTRSTSGYIYTTPKTSKGLYILLRESVAELCSLLLPL